MPTGLADKGFGREPWGEMQKAVGAEDCDLFDLLAYVAFASTPLTRKHRAIAARAATAAQFTDKQRAFVKFALAQYVKQGVDEMDSEKPAPLLMLKYGRRCQTPLSSWAGPTRCATCLWGSSGICTSRVANPHERLPGRSSFCAMTPGKRSQTSVRVADFWLTKKVRRARLRARACERRRS
ncbi:MAG: type I restriction-modification enzyme R subunit C-terminal domain-containing protein [Rubrivivax sp.]